MRTLWCFSIGAEDAAQHDRSIARRPARRPGSAGSAGSAPGPSRYIGGIPPRWWRRWCAACRAPAPASAGWRHRRCRPAPPAPISVWASSMNRMIGVGEACTSSITERRRCSNSPFIDAPACIRPMSSAQSRTSLQRRRHVAGGDALRKAFDHRGLADAGLAGEDRVVLPPAHQHVDDLADFVVAAEDRVHLAGLAPSRSGPARSGRARWCPSAPARGFGARRAGARAGRSRPSAAGFLRPSRPRSCDARRRGRRR